MSAKRIALLCSLVGSSCVVLIAQTDLFGTFAMHTITVIGLISSNASAFFYSHENDWDGFTDRRSR